MCGDPRTGAPQRFQPGFATETMGSVLLDLHVAVNAGSSGVGAPGGGWGGDGGAAWEAGEGAALAQKGIFLSRA